MITTAFYERRKEGRAVDFNNRRIVQRRNQENGISQEHRRLVSQVRRYERETFKIPVRLKIQGKEVSGYTHDISPEGLLVFTDTVLGVGVPMTLKFSFGENVCHLNVSGQVVFCQLVEHGEPSRQAIGIKFSAIRDFEKKILTSAVQELKRTTAIQEKSLLNILVSKDTLSQEGGDFSIRSPRTIVEKPRIDHYHHESGEPIRSWDISIKKVSDSLNKWAERYSYRRPIELRLGTYVISRGHKLIMLSSNDYLGLTSHPRVKEAAIKAVERYGTGTGSTAVVSGTLDLHKLLEHRLARFKSMESAILFGSGYMANSGTIATLFRNDFVLINDATNHISIFEGCWASKSRVRMYRHNDVGHLENVLRHYSDKQKVIITDSVFSVDGDLTDLKEICKLGRKYKAIVMVDDNHATGALGLNGKGSISHFHVEGEVDIVTDGLGKALAGIGGYVAGSKETINYLRHYCNMTIFTTSLAPAISATVLAALDVLESDKDLVPRLWSNVRYLRDGLLDMGFNLGSSTTHIIPVFVGNEDLAHRFARALQENGIFVVAAARPAVKRGEARLRVTPMATHSTDDLGMALTVFREAGKKFGLIN